MLYNTMKWILHNATISCTSIATALFVIIGLALIKFNIHVYGDRCHNVSLN